MTGDEDSDYTRRMQWWDESDAWESVERIRRDRQRRPVADRSAERSAARLRLAVALLLLVAVLVAIALGPGPW